MPDQVVQAGGAVGAYESPNQRWWREHGAAWPAEVGRRKRFMPCYYLQEAYFSLYFAACAPARVLEFGCGFGRHLKYLNTIKDLEVYGCDQSASMLDGARELLAGELPEDRLLLMDPSGRLPYPDRAFDVVFTNSVLIHVRPEDVGSVMAELVRICRGHILHVENRPTDETLLTSSQHEGCWAHPLVSLYRSIGVHCEILAAPNAVQGCYRVPIGKGALPAVVPQTLAVFRRLDEELSATIMAAQQDSAAVRQLREELLASRQECERHEAECREMQSKLEQVWANAEQGEMDVAQLRASAEQLQRELQRETAASESLRNQVNGIQARFAQAAAEIDSLRRESAFALQRAEQYAAECLATQDELTLARQELKRADSRWRIFLSRLDAAVTGELDGRGG